MALTISRRIGETIVIDVVNGELKAKVWLFATAQRAKSSG